MKKTDKDYSEAINELLSCELSTVNDFGDPIIKKSLPYVLAIKAYVSKLQLENKKLRKWLIEMGLLDA